MKAYTIYIQLNVDHRNNAILSAHPLQHRKAAELRWDSASKLIRVEVPERTTMS